ncbi:MAG: sigma-54 dependent transcriptional regulator [Gemmatimonadetes bacterium]|nr:sigma-54 dependent transcriptional regulator [Gemmatimonadota bacterium]
MKPRVLIVDDEQNIRRMLRALLEQEAFEVEDAESGADAPGAIESFDPDVILLDLIMPPGPDGIATLEEIRSAHPNIVVIMMSGKAALADAVRATQLGAFQFLEKPLSPEGVLVAVGAAGELAQARVENRELRDALGSSQTIVGQSSAMQHVRWLITQVAPTHSRVLITGESGTGKELVARALHEQSGRAGERMVIVNCAAIPATLVESELFGHERGAFTGAVSRRRGRFAAADGGTLFLDEVGDLGLDAQAKLLRVLETGIIEPVGGDTQFEVDVRVIAATNHDLERKVAEEGFRADLFYRLNVFPIHVPPLRDRPGDIPPLVTHLAGQVSARIGRRPAAFAEPAVQRLAAHSWPGNVRELANIVERLAIMAGDGAITEDHVEAAIGGAVAPSTPGEFRLPVRLSVALEAYEAELIREAIGAAGGNVADAARKLHTDRANLYRRMRRLGIAHRDTSVSK